MVLFKSRMLFFLVFNSYLINQNNCYFLGFTLSLCGWCHQVRYFASTFAVDGDEAHFKIKTVSGPRSPSANNTDILDRLPRNQHTQNEE